MARYTEEAHRRQSPYVLEVVEAEADAPTSKAVRTLGEWRAQLAADSDALADPIGKRHESTSGRGE